MIDSGSYGEVYKCIDLENKHRPLVVKIASDYKQFGYEINAMRTVYKKQAKNGTEHHTPEVVQYGMILFNNTTTMKEELLSYMIMPRYGQNLETCFENSQAHFSNACVLQVALACVDMLESVHSAGYVYNDLKLDNIMLGFKNRLRGMSPMDNVLEDCQLHLIDFGFATRFCDKVTKQHIEEHDVDTFRGNIIFGSLNQLNFKVTSRRDDLISLLYMMIYILNNGKLSGIDLESQMSSFEAFKSTKKAKQNHSIADLCCDRASIMNKFANEVFSYKFKDTPKYAKLRQLLTEAFEGPKSLNSINSSMEDMNDLEFNKMEIDEQASIINKVRSFFQN